MSLLVSCCPVFSVRRLGPMCWLMLFRDALEQTMFKKPVDKKKPVMSFWLELSWDFWFHSHWRLQICFYALINSIPWYLHLHQWPTMPFSIYEITKFRSASIFSTFRLQTAFRCFDWMFIRRGNLNKFIPKTETIFCLSSLVLLFQITENEYVTFVAHRIGWLEMEEWEC